MSRPARFRPEQCEGHIVAHLLPVDVAGSDDHFFFGKGILLQAWLGGSPQGGTNLEFVLNVGCYLCSYFGLLY